MHHPQNKRERFLTGVKKSKKRVYFFMSYLEKLKHPDWVKRQEQHHRDTTKNCSCFMCENPRKRGELTMQEKKFNESCE